MGPLWDVLSGCSSWDVKQQLVHVLLQGSDEASRAVSTDSAILRVLKLWLSECCSMGPSMEHLVKALMQLMHKLPVPFEVLQSERGGGDMLAAIPGAPVFYLPCFTCCFTAGPSPLETLGTGLLGAVKEHCAERHPSKEVRRLGGELMQHWKHLRLAGPSAAGGTAGK